MRSFSFQFRTTKDAENASLMLADLGMDHHRSAEGHVLVVLEHKNPEWTFNESVLRILRTLLTDFHELRAIEARDIE